MKINIVARPDHSLLLYSKLKRFYENDDISLTTFYSFRDGSFLSKVFPKRKRAPESASVLLLYTFAVRVSNKLVKVFGHNRRAFEKRAFIKFVDVNRILDTEVLHYWPFYAIELAREAKKRRIATVAEYYEAEPKYVNDIYQEEYLKYGLDDYIPSSSLIDQNESFEFETNFIVGSSFTKRSYLERYPDANIHVCSYGSLDFKLDSCSTDTIRRIKEYGVKRVVYVGHVCVEKGLPYLLEALIGGDISVDLIGAIKAGQEPVFERYRGVKNINFLGKKTNFEVMTQLKSYDLFCLPSLSDNYSLSVVEALSFGVPVLVTENCGNADDVLKFSLGGVVPVKNSDSIRSYIENMSDEFDFKSFECGLADFFSEEEKNKYVSSVREVYRSVK